MSLRQSGFRLVLAILMAAGLSLAATGCSVQPNPAPTPLDPVTTGDSFSQIPKDILESTPGEPSDLTHPIERLPGSNASDTQKLNPTFGSEDVERSIKTAQRLAFKGDRVKAAALLDQVLAIEPINREALLGRAAIAYEDSHQAKTPEAADALREKAIGLVRTLVRAHESIKPHEMQLLARVFYEKAQQLVAAGHNDQAIAILIEGTASGFDAFAPVEADEKMAPLRKSPEYQERLKKSDANRLAQARERVKGGLDKPIDMSIKFTLPDLEGKPVTLADFNGKVVLLDFWGTWCAPCRDTIPFLSGLYHLRHARGLEILGLAYERDDTDPAHAREAVKKFAGDLGIPYPCLMGTPQVLEQIPNFKAFPTSVLLDRSGKVRLLITENEKNTPALIGDAIEILLAEKPPTDRASLKKSAADTAAPKKPATDRAASKKP